MSGHEDDFYLYEESGIEEGNKRVPRWYLFVMAALALFFIYYVVTYFTGVQPNSAQIR